MVRVHLEVLITFMTNLKENLLLWLTLVATYTLMRVIPQNSYYLRAYAGRGGVATFIATYLFGRDNTVMRILVFTYLSNRRVFIEDSRENIYSEEGSCFACTN